ncbi:DUF2306 domain-containing protein [Paenarthrobacter sp. PH39-S1]|uniref:DUF2306 domain-containing protein n=1 Tax=Paenarthrobacter sp. PH39-S1 TaxID=3046204 RepID=UPI0024B9A95F|nr:DUF2306 domain-containing protein [Paenarthrobacter sp. PH39-S1]MDJ0357234.1 DUF2306 domain-containing protein [Paenarthrobacter sp. PH39-S1]
MGTSVADTSKVQVSDYFARRGTPQRYVDTLWMTQFYPRQPGTGALLYVLRLAFGSGMAASIILGFAAIRRGNIARHRAWMTRAYALALGAGTQAFTQGIGNVVFGSSKLTTTLMLGAGWAINLTVGEHITHRHSSSRTSSATAEVGFP